MNFQKHRLIVLYAILLSFCFIVGCSKQSQPIKIGVIGTMSGINSDLSVSGRRGVELAAREINAGGGINGRRIELVIKDDQNNQDIVQKAFRQFIDEKVHFIIGPYTSGMIINVIDDIRKEDILVLSPTISADTLSGKDDNFIRFIATTKGQAKVITDIAMREHHKKFAVIYDSKNNGFIEPFYNNFKILLERDNGEIVLTKTFLSQGKTDYSNLVTEVTKSNAEAVLIIANSAQNAELTQQLRKIGCKLQIYSPLWSNSSDLINKGGSAVEGMYIVAGIDLNSDKEVFVKFKENYLDRYGEDPTFSSVYSYEASLALFQAIDASPNMKPTTVKNSIMKISKFKSLGEDFQIDEFGDNTRGYIICRIENGQLRKVD